MMNDSKFYDMLSSLVDGAFDETFKLARKKEKVMEPEIREQHDLSEDASAVYDAFQEMNGPQGKSFLVAKSGILPHKWNPAIKELKDNGFVVQTGNKRGAKYSIA